MCLKDEKYSNAKPESEVYGYVVMNPVSVLPLNGNELFTSRHDVRDRLWNSRASEPKYKLSKWYKARYFPNKRLSYVECNRKNPPGFHAYRRLGDAMYNVTYDSQVVVRAKFKGVVMNGSYDGDPCFRAMFRSLKGVVER